MRCSDRGKAESTLVTSRGLRSFVGEKLPVPSSGAAGKIMMPQDASTSLPDVENAERSASHPPVNERWWSKDASDFWTFCAQERQQDTVRWGPKELVPSDHLSVPGASG